MYAEMFRHVKEQLDKNDHDVTDTGSFPFRTRSGHIKRVFMWAERLMEGGRY